MPAVPLPHTVAIVRFAKTRLIRLFDKSLCMIVVTECGAAPQKLTKPRRRSQSATRPVHQAHSQQKLSLMGYSSLHLKLLRRHPSCRSVHMKSDRWVETRFTHGSTCARACTCGYAQSRSSDCARNDSPHCVVIRKKSAKNVVSAGEQRQRQDDSGCCASPLSERNDTYLSRITRLELDSGRTTQGLNRRAEVPGPLGCELPANPRPTPASVVKIPPADNRRIVFVPKSPITIPVPSRSGLISGHCNSKNYANFSSN